MILNILLFSFLFDWYYKMVSPQNGDTRGGPPPPPAPLATPLLLVHSFHVKFQLCFAMPYCSMLFALSEQYSLSWRISIVVCPDGQGEGSR